VKFGFIPVEDSRYYQEALKQVELAEELGFDSVWLEEHHGTSRHYHPSPLIYLAGFATRTEQIQLGTDIAVLPLYHPVRLAEDIAQLDIMSKGRVILGAAIGYREEEFAAFQTPLKGRGAQFEEMLELIKCLWMENHVDFNSERYTLNNFTLEPKPLQKPRPPIWLGGWGRLSIRRAAVLGDAWIPGPTANLAKLKEAQARYNDHLLELGIDPQSRPRPLTRDVVIAARDEDAQKLAQSYLLPAYRDEYSTWSHPLIGASDSTATDILEELRKDRFIIGSPSRVIEQIDYFIEQFGMDHLICRLHFPGMPPNKVLEAVRLIGEEILPVFKNKVAAKR
jgi:probable F420-dependent oxidoreductase